MKNKKQSKPKKEEPRLKVVEVSIEDVVQYAEKQILESCGGIGINDIKRLHGLAF